MQHSLQHAPLGKSSTYISEYEPSLLFPVARKVNRDKLGIGAELPFQGMDCWNAFELSWLNAKGKPVIAAAEFLFACESPNLIESKSFKLYLNSFNNSRFASFDEVQQILSRDLSSAADTPVVVKLMPLNATSTSAIQSLAGHCLDELDVSCDTYLITPNYLQTEDKIVTETIYSDLLKSNCLVTGQPDWGSVQIAYTGKQIQHEGLLKYIVSYRNVSEFAETGVERIFTDIMRQCQPEKLCVHVRYTRRGGLDINPYRSNYPVAIENMRLWRQ